MSNDDFTPEMEQDANQIPEEELEEETQEEETDNDSDSDDDTDWKAEALKQKAINKRLSQKLEKPVKKDAKVEKSEETSINLNAKDLYVLNQANVHVDDIDDVVEYAAFKKISIAEALKSSAVKAILSEKEEYRTTAQSAHTGTAKKGNTKISDEKLLSNLSKGQIPEKGSEEAMRLFNARHGIKN